jgi:hypothetical protein
MNKLISVKQILIYFIILLIVWAIAMYNPFMLEMNKHTKLPLLDITTNYSPEQAYNYMDELGGDGRTAYMHFLFFIDTAFPISYSILVFLILSFFMQRISKKENPLYLLRFSPFMLGLLDLMQNVVELILLFNYPDRLLKTAQACSIITTVKMNTGLLVLIIIIIAVIINIIRFFNKKKETRDIFEK